MLMTNQNSDMWNQTYNDIRKNVFINSVFRSKRMT